MTDYQNIGNQIMAEFTRLGLSLDDCPHGGMVSDGPDSANQFLSSLRAMLPGVTWWDVFPDLPSHWIPGQPDTWTTPYRPMGSYDYQTLPTGPAVHVSWPRSAEDSCLDTLVTNARNAGWKIYGAGSIPIANPEWPMRNAYLILTSGTSHDEVGRFTNWLETQPDVTLAGISRSGDEEYFVKDQH